jgi:hypothetical protein
MSNEPHAYGLRSGTQPTTRMPGNATSGNLVMSPEQFERLLASLKTGSGPTLPTTSGNLADCKSRFAGARGESVAAFIDAVTIYKDCVGVSDLNALKGLAMLLDGAAATWWQGTKATVDTWETAINALRRSFGEVKPNYKIFRELFSRQQKDTEATDMFVNSARALLSKLSPTPPLHEIHQIDMIYGLLSSKIRRLVPRDELNNFETFIAKTRGAEDALKEEEIPEIEKGTKTRPKCSYCGAHGHTEKECRKLARSQEATPARQATTTRTNPGQICFGCRQLGHVRSQCPNERQRRNSTTAEILTAGLGDVCRASMPVTIAGKEGLAYVDSGASRSIAGHNLYGHLKRIKAPFTRLTQELTMADGEPVEMATEVYKVQVEVNDRIVHTSVTAIPEHSRGKTLLGMDFIKAADVILDFPRMQWRFRGQPNWGPLVSEKEVSLAASTVQLEPLRDDEGTELDKVQKDQLVRLLDSHKEVFEESDEPTPYAEHRITLTDDRPIATTPYRMSPQRRAVLEVEIQRMVEKNVIEECESPYAAPVVMVPKKDGSFRVCVDFRKLNSVTVPDCYPLPRIDDVLHAARQNFYMSTLDLKSGFWQVPVRPEDRDKTAFVTPFGLYRFLRMPFGLRNSPATFQRLIDRFKVGLPNVFLVAYMDDIIVLSPTLDRHLEDLEEVFTRLRLFKLGANRRKCVFACAEVKFLGHIIKKGGISADPDKVSAILHMEAPRNVRQLLSFLQTCSWFRRFVPGFSDVAKPLTELTKKTAVWTWGTAQEDAFAKLKDLLSAAPILRQADSSLSYTLRTDASSYALGACLLQGEGPDERPVEYASRLLTPAEKNYTTTEREALAIVFGVQKFRGYLEGARVIVASDHQPLKWLMSLRSPSGRLARWALLLQSFDLRVDYIPGRRNVVADMLSRPPIADLDASSKLEACFASINIPTVSATELRNEQSKDETLKKIVLCFEDGADEGLARWTDRGYVMSGGILYRYVPDSETEEPQLVVPQQLVPAVLKEFHDSTRAGHPGVERTIEKVSRHYFWSTLRHDVRKHVRQCADCQRYKFSNMKPTGLLQTPTLARRFETLAIDLYGPLPVTSDGKRWVFAIEDTATRWMELFPLAKATAEACAKCLVDEVILRYGTPRKVISDNGSQFVSEIMQQTAYCLGIEQILTPVYYPAANPEERRNRELTVQLAIAVEKPHDRWSLALPSVRFAMNSTVHAALGKTPAFLCFGRELRTPLEAHHDLRAVLDNENFVPEITPHLRTMTDILKDVRETYERQQDKVKKYADLRRRPSPPFEVGDRVLVDVHALSRASHSYTSKFAPRRDGPYVVIEKKGPVAYVVAAVDDPERPLGKYHVSALRPFVSSVGESHSEPVAPLRRRGRPRKAQPDDRPEDETTPNQPRSPPRHIRGVRRGRRGAARPREVQT